VLKLEKCRGNIPPGHRNRDFKNPKQFTAGKVLSGCGFTYIWCWSGSSLKIIYSSGGLEHHHEKWKEIIVELCVILNPILKSHQLLQEKIK
jgi:hypothetical protein